MQEVDFLVRITVRDSAAEGERANLLHSDGGGFVAVPGGARILERRFRRKTDEYSRWTLSSKMRKLRHC